MTVGSTGDSGGASSGASGGDSGGATSGEAARYEEGWAGRRVLVTGAAGFIGSHLAERLSRLGATVRVLVRYNSRGQRGWLDTLAPDVADGIEVLAGDVRDRDFVVRAVDGSEVVFHLAALIAIPYSYSAPQSYLDTNAGGTLNVAQAARDKGVERLVHTSTSEVYGSARTVPMSEEHPLTGQSPYSATKIAADKIVESFHLSFGLRATTLRPFNTFGPRQSTRAVVPSIIVQALEARRRGERRIRLGALTPTRDFNYVDNTVDAFLAIARAEGAIGEVVNAGTGVEITIAETARKIGEAVGVALEIEEEGARLRPRDSEVDRLCADARKAERLCGWTPRVSLDEGLSRTAAWFEQHAHLYRTQHQL